MLRRSHARFCGATITVPVDDSRIPFAKFEPTVRGKKHVLPEIPKEVTFPAERPMEWFKFMTTCRRMEQNSDVAYKEKRIKGFLHLYSGQEAIPTGMGNYLQPDDSISTTYRCHAWYHWCRGRTGKDGPFTLTDAPMEVFAEMFGKGPEVSASKGKGGSMHLYSPENKFHGGAGIVGAGTATGAGEGLGYVYRNGHDDPKNMAITLYGDGAANQGQLFEAYNMAALWRLPVLFVCENNHFGMGTAESRHAYNTHFWERGGHLPGLRADGNNIFTVMAATEVARKYILGGNGPMVLEFDTYRFSGHSMSDPGLAYRTPDEVKEMRQKRDPISFLNQWIVSQKIATEEELKRVTKQCNKAVDAQMEKAKALPEPPEEELYSDVLLQPHVYDYHVKTCQGTKYYPTAKH